MTDIPSPQHRLSNYFIKATRLREIIENSIFLLVLAILFYLDYRFHWIFWIGWILIGLTILTVVAAIWTTAFRPLLLYRNTRYDLDEDFLQLKSGALFEKHELVPMTKIQSVETNQGPIMRKFGLYHIAVETMGSSHSISGLSKERAMEVRNQIAHYAKIKEVEI